VILTGLAVGHTLAFWWKTSSNNDGIEGPTGSILTIGLPKYAYLFDAFSVHSEINGMIDGYEAR
jgi:hypothetical protein